MKITTLKNQKDFDAVFTNKQVFGNRHFTLLYVKNELTINRIGIIIGKKFSKKAVCRNKMRRQIKSIYMQNADCMKIGYDFIIIPKKRCLNDVYSEISSSFMHLFFKQGLLMEKESL